MKASNERLEGLNHFLRNGMTVIEGLFVEIEKELREMNQAVKDFNDKNNGSKKATE